jgi:hypothetical protein
MARYFDAGPEYGIETSKDMDPRRPAQEFFQVLRERI